MVEVVVVLLEAETVDLGGLMAVAKCKFEGSKRQTSSKKRDLVMIDRRTNMKETRVMAVTQKAMTDGNEKTEDKKWSFVMSL